MPESKGRKAADDKAVIKRKSEAAARRSENKVRQASLESPPWLAPLFIGVGLLGVLWLVLYYIAAAYIPFMAALGGWNVVIGMVLMTACFLIATQWK